MSDTKSRNAAILQQLVTAECARGVTLGYALAHAPEVGGALDWEGMLTACATNIERAHTAKRQEQVEEWNDIHSKVLGLAAMFRPNGTTH